MFQNATFLRKSEPGPLTSLMNMSLALRLPHDMHLSRSSSNVPRLPTFLELPQNLHGLLMCGKVQNPLCLPHRTRFNVPKWSEHVVFFLPFDFEMCFAPKRRANFHLSSRKMAPHEPLQWAYFSTLRSRNSLEKLSRLFHLFAHLQLLSSDSLSSLICFLLLFSSLLRLFPLCFSILFICPCLTSKLPSMILSQWMFGILPIYRMTKIIKFQPIFCRDLLGLGQSGTWICLSICYHMVSPNSTSLFWERSNFCNTLVRSGDAVCLRYCTPLRQGKCSRHWRFLQTSSGGEGFRMTLLLLRVGWQRLGQIVVVKTKRKYDRLNYDFWCFVALIFGQEPQLKLCCTHSM